MSAPIVITIPNYVNVGKSIQGSPVKIISGDDVVSSQNRGKKRRLDHLSWEEKLQRKKLKNRVAAQTSRDRKKAKMDEMEYSLEILRNQNETLISECQKLRELNEKLLAENVELRENYAAHSCCKKQTSLVGCGLDIEGPAASADPLQKGRAPQPAAQLLLKILILSHLLPNSVASTQNSTLTNLKNLHKICSKTSMTNLKQVLKEKIARGDLTMKNAQLPAWWGRHQNTWNPVEVEA